MRPRMISESRTDVASRVPLEPSVSHRPRRRAASHNKAASSTTSTPDSRPLAKILTKKGLPPTSTNALATKRRAPPSRTAVRAVARTVIVSTSSGPQSLPTPDRSSGGQRHQHERAAVAEHLHGEQHPHRPGSVQTGPEDRHRDEHPQRVVAVRRVDAVEGRAMAMGHVAGDAEVVERVVEGQRERRIAPDQHDRQPHGGDTESAHHQDPGRAAGSSATVASARGGDLLLGRHARVTSSPRSSPRPRREARSSTACPTRCGGACHGSVPRRPEP